jgi:hypothetical protein
MQGSVMSVSSQHQQQQDGQQQPGGGGALTMARKTIGRLFGAGGSGEAAGATPPATPNGGGLIAAFRAIIPKISGVSTGERWPLWGGGNGRCCLALRAAQTGAGGPGASARAGPAARM